MSYTALYRKFRPQVFEDVKGQEHIVTTLRNQITTGRIGHAYLFFGTRGTGKTTIAKIFARAINCTNLKDGNPCGECPSCQAAAAGNNMNIIEIDGASNNGVNNIREIIEEVAYSPVDAKYKVYIIDEAHMITDAAFNALLKTLEEPPSYVVFILATTELNGVSPTIRSRCQRYDFRRITLDTIAERLRGLAEIEKINVEDRALRYLARMADGSLRDALSLLDRCATFHYGEELTYDMVLDVLGTTDIEMFSEMIRNIIKDDVIGCIELLEKIVMQGRELGQFVTDFTWYLRNIMLVKSSGKEGAEDLLDISTENMKRLMEEVDMLEDLDQIFRYITIFSDLSGRLKFASQKRVLVEMTLIKACRPQMETNQESLIERLRMLEEKMERGIPMTSVTIENSENRPQTAPPPKVPAILPEAIPEDIQRIVRDWQVIKGMTEYLTRASLEQAKLSLGDAGQLLICFENKFTADQLRQEDKTRELQKLFNEYAEKEVKIEIRDCGEDENFNNHFVDISKLINMEIDTD